jgi:TetR/AcrR family transcriptional regulator, tetracycline repressor protein
MTLTRGEILDAALRHAREGQLDQLTVRRLAEELDVTPMALYRHIRDKDDILENVADALLADVGLPDPSAPWSEYLVELATSLRQLLHEHPPILTLFTRRPLITPMAIARLNGASGVLTRAGYSPADAHRIYATVHTYTLGFCALERARQRVDAPRTAAGSPERVIVDFVSEDQFRFGLRALVTEGHG